MKRTLALTGTMALAAMVGLFAQEKDKKIEMKDLPPAVQKAVQEETMGATIKGYAIETEKGQKFYEAETTVNGHARDLLFEPSGKLVSVEEEIAMDAVPAPVKATLASKGKIIMVETVTKGKDVSYEGVVEKNGKKSEVAVSADGKVIKP